MTTREDKKGSELRQLMGVLQEDYVSPENDIKNGMDEFIVATSFLATLKFKNRKVDLEKEIMSTEALSDLGPIFKPYIDKKMGFIDRLLEDYDIDVLETAIVFDDIYNNRTDLNPTPRRITELALHFL